MNEMLAECDYLNDKISHIIRRSGKIYRYERVILDNNKTRNKLNVGYKRIGRDVYFVAWNLDKRYALVYVSDH
jgi:hypothetical protein